MEQLIEKLRQYLVEIIDMSITVDLWKREADLPFFLIDSYYFYTTSLYSHPCLLVVAKEHKNITPAVIRKHFDQIQKKWDGCCIFVQETLSSYDRKRLIEAHIPFIIPGNQMYLPHFGLDLREYFRRLPDKKHSFFSPATQAFVIYALIRTTNERLTPALGATKLGYSVMTMSRVFKELETSLIGNIQHEGRERWWVFPNKKELWRQANTFLSSPVKKRVWLKHHKSKIVSGLTALSHFSMLTPPIQSVYAIGVDEWGEWKRRGDIEEMPFSEEADCELEIWHYDPNFFAKSDIVDPFSLYLSLKENGNERIESALEEMMYNSS